MFLNTKAPLNAMKFSIVLNNSILERYNSFLNYNDSNAKFKLLKKEDTINIYKKFMEILKGKYQNTIFLFNVDLNDNGFTVFHSANVETQLAFSEMLYIFNYINFQLNIDKQLFLSIQKELIDSNDPDLALLLKEDYSFFDLKDFNSVMHYFWNDTINYRILK